MRAQIAEALDAISRMSTHGLTVNTPPSMLSRLSAGAAILSTQRGATDPMDQSMFSSPLQRTTSNGLRARFTDTPSSPPRVRRMNAVSTLTDDDEPNEN
jgi:hypothetical protein